MRSANDAHDCDYGVLRTAYDMLKRDLGRVTANELVANTDVPLGRVLQWIETSDTMFLNSSGVIEETTNKEQEPEKPGVDPTINLLLQKIHDSGRELGALQVEIALMRSKLERVSLPYAGLIRKLLRYSWRDIEFRYEGLTPEEQKLGSREELEYLMKWAATLD